MEASLVHCIFQIPHRDYLSFSIVELGWRRTKEGGGRRGEFGLFTFFIPTRQPHVILLLDMSQKRTPHQQLTRRFEITKYFLPFNRHNNMERHGPIDHMTKFFI